MSNLCPYCEAHQLRTQLSELQAENERLKMESSCHLTASKDRSFELTAMQLYTKGLRDALAELCRLKVTKEIEGKTDKYLKAQPIAWNSAIQILNSTPPDLSAVEGLVKKCEFCRIVWNDNNNECPNPLCKGKNK